MKRSIIYLMSKGEARSHLLHYYCRLCDSNCSSDLVLRQHLYGKKHRKSCISCSSSFGQIDQVFLGSNLVCDSLGSSLLPFPAEVLDCRLDDIFLETFYERCSPSERGLKRIVNVVDEILLILKPGPISSHLNTILVGSFPSKTMIRSRPTFDIVLLFGAIPSPEEGQFCVSLRPPFGLVASKNNIWVKVLLTSSQALQRKNGLPPAHYEMLKRG
ncbi:uncharacterized protein LOC135144310 isoform X2 [Zophobas morio]|uniref:uncharacterized protein LOC135144310 isoform X2 n=1 Tax=Zophobas morio TaxID=2755281 RepID=UPI003082733A